jgi:hypothetical protein
MNRLRTKTPISLAALAALQVIALLLHGCKSTDDNAALVSSISASRSTLEISETEIQAGDAVQVQLKTLDKNGSPVIASEVKIQLGFTSRVTSLKDVPSGGVFDPVVDHQDGTYTALFKATTVGTASKITARINDQITLAVSDAEFFVVPGKVSIPKSGFLTPLSTKIAVGETLALVFQLRDSSGNALTQGGPEISFMNQEAGTSRGTFSKVMELIRVLLQRIKLEQRLSLWLK